METVLKPFLTRFAQPVILSFCIAWIFWNWEIVVGLIWYDKNTLPLYGYANYKELINQNANWQRNYLYPVLIAVFYPYLRFGLNYFNVVLETEERNQTLSASGSGKISTLKFLKLRKSYEDKIAELSKYFDDQSNIITRFNETETELIKTRNELQISQKSLLETRMMDQSSLEISIRKDHELLSSQEKVVKLKKIIEKLENQINEISSGNEMSYPDSLRAEYTLRLYHVENDGLTLVAKSEGSIVKDNDVLELEINKKRVGEVAKYIFNIIDNSFVIMFTRNQEFQDSQWLPITNKYLFFHAEDQKKDFFSAYISDEVSYKFELKKIN